MGLSLIAEVMGWPGDQAEATQEYAWLRMMSSVKYDGHSYFRAGVRFIETPATWLKQFEPADRAVAYNLVKRRLIYFSLPEIECLVDNFIPEVVTPNLRTVVASDLGVKPYEVWKDSKGAAAFDRQLRKVLFVGLSDGSRIDLLPPEQLLTYLTRASRSDDECRHRKMARDLSDNLARSPIAPEQAVKMEPET